MSEQWRDGHIVITGMSSGERVALSVAAKVRWRIINHVVSMDRDVSLSALMSGLDPQLELHDHEQGLVYTRPLSDLGCHGFHPGHTLDIEESHPALDHRALLKKYISHVTEVEGLWLNPERYRTNKFTADEVSELQKLAEEA